MANAPFDRTIFNPLERPLADDVNQLQSTADYGLRLLIQQMYDGIFRGANPLGGCVGGGFKVVPTSPATNVVQLLPGLAMVDGVADTPAAINGIVGLDDLFRGKPITLGGFGLSIGVPAAPGSNSRIDLVELKYGRRVTDPLSRDSFDPLAGDFVPGLINKTLSFAVGSGDVTYNGVGLINYKTGVVAGSPVPPATSSGYIALATIRVATGTSTYDADVITDERQVGFANSTTTAMARFRIGPSTPAGLLLDSAAPPGIGLYVMFTAGNGFFVTATGNFRASALATSFENVSGSPITMVTTTQLGPTTVDTFLAADLLNPSLNLMGASKVAVGQKCRHYAVRMMEQKGSSPFSFDQPLSVDYNVEVQLTLA